MPKVGLVIVGDGILYGDFIDGASTLVLAEIENHGASVNQIEICGNSPSQVQASVERLQQDKNLDLVITVGALGVDLRGHNHRLGVARALGAELNYYPYIENLISRFSDREALSAHALQANNSMGFDTGATVPLFFNIPKIETGKVPVASLSAYPDLLDRQLGALIENGFYPPKEDALYPQVFNSSTANRYTRQADLPKSKIEKLRKLREAIDDNDEFTKGLRGVHIVFDISGYSPQRFAYFARHLAVNNIAITSVSIGDPHEILKDIPTTDSLIVVSDQDLDLANFSEPIQVDTYSPHAITDFDTSSLPKIFRTKVKTNSDIDDIQQLLLSSEIDVWFNSRLYSSVPNLDDPSASCVIEVSSTTLEELREVLHGLETLRPGEFDFDEDIFEYEARSNTISIENWDVPYSPQDIMQSPSKFLVPLPDEISRRAHELLGVLNTEYAHTQEAQELVDNLVAIWTEQNTPGQYEFDVYERSLGMLRPVAIIAINELCVKYDLDLPEIVTPGAFERAVKLVEQVRPSQLENVMGDVAALVIDQSR